MNGVFNPERTVRVEPDSQPHEIFWGRSCTERSVGIILAETSGCSLAGARNGASRSRPADPALRCGSRLRTDPRPGDDARSRPDTYRTRHDWQPVVDTGLALFRNAGSGSGSATFRWHAVCQGG